MFLVVFALLENVDGVGVFGGHCEYYIYIMVGVVNNEKGLEVIGLGCLIRGL